MFLPLIYDIKMQGNNLQDNSYDFGTYHMSLVMRKPAFCICETKDADQLCGYRKADQRLCFRYIDSTIPLLPIYESTIPLLPIYEISSL